MHTHVIRTVTRELAETMDYWGDPATGARGLQAHYCGGRDWVVTMQHPNHPADSEVPDHDDNAGGRLDEIGVPTARYGGSQPAARTATVRRKDNGWDQFVFLDDDGNTVGEFNLMPQHVTVVHDRPLSDHDNPGSAWAWPNQ